MSSNRTPIYKQTFHLTDRDGYIPLEVRQFSYQFLGNSTWHQTSNHTFTSNNTSSQLWSPLGLQYSYRN